ncbi:tetratricopeptide repeat protein [Aegicerativicinus sediminis]|uniref:tetratricopeptide repeat protein n=1 Tax=Aegicerativicinus sediminis TaxID=2893202 RepID=UPI001E4E27E9|nr:tetratricopeptide repeat protein [Aegicerativicinus sediminis]
MKSLFSLFPFLVLIGLLIPQFNEEPKTQKKTSLLPSLFKQTICGTYIKNTSGIIYPHQHCVTPVTSIADNLPSPGLMEGVGYSNLKITTNSDLAQTYFNQGLALMYDFWRFEAYRSFKHVTELDSTAAMGYWGMAISLMRHPDPTLKKGQMDAMKMAESLSAKLSDKEQKYIKALKLMLEEEDEQKAKEKFTQVMQEVILEYPEDVDAKLILWNNGLDYDYEPYGRPKKHTLIAEYLLRDLLNTHPNHPGVNHFWIHQMEQTAPEQALQSAKKLATLTPNSGHMVHMPGHIYYNLGDYEKAREHFLNSLKVDSIYLASANLSPAYNWNFGHNLRFLTANSAEQGRVKEAYRWQERLLDTTKWTHDRKDPIHIRVSTINFYMATIGRAELWLKFRDWDRAVSTLNELNKNEKFMEGLPIKKPIVNSLLNFFKGMQAVENGKFTLADQYANELDAENYRTMINGEELDENESVKSIFESPINRYSLLLQAEIASPKKGEFKKAEQLFLKALKVENSQEYSDPPLYWMQTEEMMGWFYLKHEKWEKAREMFSKALENSPNSGYILYGLAELERAQGNKRETTIAYEKFLEAWKHADNDLPSVIRAKSWLK